MLSLPKLRNPFESKDYAVDDVDALPHVPFADSEAVADSCCAHWHLPGSGVMSISFATQGLSPMPWEFALHAAKQLRSAKDVMLSGANLKQWGTEICR